MENVLVPTFMYLLIFAIIIIVILIILKINSLKL
jgi:hypothetical protein